MLCARIFDPLVSALWYSVCLLASSSASGLAADPDDVLLTCQQRVDDAYLAGHVYVLGEDRLASRASGWTGPGSRLARPGLSSTIWDLTFTSQTVFTDRRAFAYAVPRSRHCRTPTGKL